MAARSEVHLSIIQLALESLVKRNARNRPLLLPTSGSIVASHSDWLCPVVCTFGRECTVVKQSSAARGEVGALERKSPQLIIPSRKQAHPDTLHVQHSQHELAVRPAITTRRRLLMILPSAKFHRLTSPQRLLYVPYQPLPVGMVMLKLPPIQTAEHTIVGSCVITRALSSLLGGRAGEDWPCIGWLTAYRESITFVAGDPVR